MRSISVTSLMWVCAFALAIDALAQTPLGTGFTYQGQLKKNGAPLSGTADLRFALWDAVAGGTQIGSTLAIDNWPVTNGLLTVQLDFGAVFTGDARWLEVAVRAPAGCGSFTALSPRQELTATPHTLYSLDTQKIGGHPVSTALPAEGLVLKWDGGTWAPAGDNDTTYSAGTGLTLAGTQFALDLTYADNRYVNEGQLAGGDLSGSYPDPLVDGLQGRAVSSTAPIAGQALKWSGSAWAPAADNDTTYAAGTGLTLAGTTFSLDLAYADSRYVNEGQSAGGDLTGTYPNPTIANNAINSAKILDGSVGLADLAANSVDGSKIVDGSVALADLASNSVNSTKIVDGSVALADLASNSVDSSKIIDGSVALADLASNSVDSSKIADGSVALADLASNSVNSSKIVDGGVALADLAASSVDSSKIVDGAVTFSKLGDPLSIGSTWWDWDITSGGIDIDITSAYPAMNIESTCTTYGDCLHLLSSAAAGTSTWVLYAYTQNGNSGFFSKSTDDNTYAVYIASPANNSEGLYVYGNTVATGTKSAAIETSQGPQAIFSVESPEVEIYASGSAVLSGGAAYVAFDPLFTEAVSPEVEIRVTVTPIGGWSGLYIESTSPEGFIVASAAGEPNIRFHWMACGRRLGYEVRPNITIPDPAEEEAIRQAKEAAHAANRASR